MRKLNCKSGDLAITVRAEVPQNLGRVVHIVKSLGAQDWSTFGAVQMWWVEAISGSSRPLHYLCSDGTIKLARAGPVPDLLLTPIVPPEGFNEVSDWLRLHCARPADIAQWVAKRHDYEEALRRSES